MNEQIAMVAFNNVYETLSFLVGGILMLTGLFMGAVMTGQWKNKGMILLSSGSLITFPAVIPLMMIIISAQAETYQIPSWLFYLVSIYGVSYAIIGWVLETRKHDN